MSLIIMSNYSSYLSEFTPLCPSSYYKKCLCFQIAVLDGSSLVPWQVNKVVMVAGNGMFWQCINDSAFNNKKMKNILLLFTLFISVKFASLKNRYPKGTKKLVYKLKFNFIWEKKHNYYSIDKYKCCFDY